MQNLVVVILFLEVFAVSKEIEQFEVLLWNSHILYFTALPLLMRESVFSSTAPLNLNEISRREYGAHQSNIQYVFTVVACGHHPNCYANSRFAGAVSLQELCVPVKVIISKTYSKALRIGNVRGNLHSKIRIILSRKELV